MRRRVGSREWGRGGQVKVGGGYVLWVNTEPGPVRLHELEQNELGSFVHVGSAEVLRTVAF